MSDEHKQRRSALSGGPEPVDDRHDGASDSAIATGAQMEDGEFRKRHQPTKHELGLGQQDLQSPFYDVTGAPMDAGEFRKRYKARGAIARTSLWGVRISSEFVGINHEHDTRKTPLIYETCILAGFVLVHSTWSGGYKRALLRHVALGLFTVLGGALWWHLRAMVWGEDQWPR